jgi:hypothetical protein
MLVCSSPLRAHGKEDCGPTGGLLTHDATNPPRFLLEHNFKGAKQIVGVDALYFELLADVGNLYLC